MGKLDRIRVLVPLNFLLYIGALWLTGFYPGWGCFALALADGFTIAVIYLIARRYVEFHELSSWQRVAPKLVVPFVVLGLLGIAHVGGGVVGAFTGSDLLQHIIAYGSVTFVVLGVVVYGTKKGKTLYWDN